MKNILIILLLITTTVNAKYKPKYNKPVKKTPITWDDILSGNHELLSLNVTTERKSEMNGMFFIIGAVNSKSYSETLVTFSWKTINDEYIISKLPIHKIRIKIDNSVTIPYVKFRWCTPFGLNFNIDKPSERVMKEHIIYMVVVCRDEDYPFAINFYKEN